MVQLFQAQGIEVHEVHPEVSSHRNGEGVEIDLLVVNDGALVAVESKSKLTQAHVDEHLVRMEKQKRLLPLYKNHRALGGCGCDGNERQRQSLRAKPGVLCAVPKR